MRKLWWKDTITTPGSQNIRETRADGRQPHACRHNGTPYGILILTPNQNLSFSESSTNLRARSVCAGDGKASTACQKLVEDE